MRKYIIGLACLLWLAGPVSGEELTREQRVERANQLYKDGRSFVEEGDYASANARFAEAQALLGEELSSPPRAQDVPGKKNRKALAEDRMRRADALYNEAVIHIKTEEIRKAQSCLEEAVRLNPRDKDAYYNLGIIYERYLKDRNEAVKCYLRYVFLEADEAKAAVVKGWVKELKKGAVK
mgnify:CR=1 FL=1